MAQIPRSVNAWLPSVAVAFIGFGSCVVIARVVGTDASDTAALIGLAGGTSAFAGVVIAFVGRALSTRPLRTQLAAIALGSLLGIGLGTLVGAQAMFLSRHDTNAITVLLVAGGTVGVLAVLTLTRRLDRSLAGLGALVQQIEPPGGPNRGPAAIVAGPPELQGLAEEVRDVRARLDEANRRQRALETSRSDLITWVSHDLGEPLARIRHLAGRLDDVGHVDSALIARHHELRSEVDRLATIVDDLLELSSREAAPGLTVPEPSSDRRPDELFDLAFADQQASARVAVSPADHRQL